MRVCPLRLKAPLAPPVAARLERVNLDFAGMKTAADWWQGRVEVLLIEGVGGLLCPLTEDKTIADLAVALGYPLLVVARAGLGTINHTLLTVEAARHRGLQVAGVVLNEAEPLEETPGTGENSGRNRPPGQRPRARCASKIAAAEFAESGRGPARPPPIGVGT